MFVDLVARLCVSVNSTVTDLSVSAHCSCMAKSVSLYKVRTMKAASGGVNHSLSVHDTVVFYTSYS